MTPDGNNKNNYVNTHVDTGAPVTRDEAIAYERQMRADAESRYIKQTAKKAVSNTDAGADLKQKLCQVVSESIERQITKQEKQRGKKAFWFQKHIAKVNSFILADMTLAVVMDGVRAGYSERAMQEHLGDAYVSQLFWATMSKTSSSRRMINKLDKDVTEKTKDGEFRRKQIFRAAERWGYDRSDWTVNEKAKVGAMLLSCVKEATDLVRIKKMKKDGDKKRTKYVISTEKAEELQREHTQLFAELSQYWRPMIWPPNEWHPNNLGPYLAPEIAVMIDPVRNASPDQAKAIEEGMESGEMSPLFEALNFIQRTPYKINGYVLEAVQWLQKKMLEDEEFVDDLKKKGIKVKKFPALNKIPAEMRPERKSPEDFKKLSKEEQIDLAREHQDIQQDDAEVVANVSTVGARVDTASKMQKYERFWLPHNFDYRGRVYHVPDFGPHNADWTRGLMLFANAKPIGDREEYLALQIANTYGMDKRPLHERVEWVLRNENAICGTGAEFVRFFDFWAKAKEPFQFLAACHEWHNYRQVGPDYCSGLPVGLDATQSGVQHYAAASLNPSDGKLVNLTKGDKPNDFYEACLVVAKRMINEDLTRNLADLESDPWTDEERKELEEHLAFMAQELPSDFEEGRKLEDAKLTAQDEFADTEAARKHKRDKNIEAAQQVLALGNAYDRGVIKRNSMTYGYSSRAFGFAEQLRTDWMKEFTKDLRAERIEEHPFGRDRGFHAASYLAKIHQDAIEEVVSSVKDGMQFLRDIADILSDDDEKKMRWGRKTVPVGKHFKFVNRMGFPFFQYYRRGNTKAQKVFGFDRPTQQWDNQTQSWYKKFTERVDKKKARDGISPNTIHSQDSCHLLMTALACKDAGITDVMFIHDSFATTVADTYDLAVITRQQFIDLYSDYCLWTDVLEQAKKLHSAPDKVKWPRIPEKGHEGLLLDLNEVMESDYFFN